MGRKSAAELREQIRGESARLRSLTESRDRAARLAREYGADVRKATELRDRHLLSARRAGVSVAELAEDTGLSPGRVRQIAPLPSSPGASAPRPAAVTARIEQEQDQEVPDAAAAAAAEVVRVPTSELGAPAVRQSAAAGRARGERLPPLETYSIADRVHQALVLAGGDVEAASRALDAVAIQDAMTLLGQSRVGATYDHTAHPKPPPPLVRPDRKRSDLIWEGRPHWQFDQTPPGTVITRLDMNGSYLAALRRTHLPIGGLVQDPPGTVFDRRRAGIYLVEVAPWPVTNLPNPLGSREQAGPVWVTDATLRLLHRVHAMLAVTPLATPAPRVLESWTSGSSENLLTKFGDQLAAARAAAIEADDEVTLTYVKAMYSKFVSTAGDSRANHDLERPEWVHAIRSQAFANLWLKAERAVSCGLLVHKVSGTDELHVAGNWRAARMSGVERLAFPEGRGLAEVKVKGTYVVGQEDDDA